MNSHTAPAVDVAAFRKAMGSFPTGVTVVTVASGDGTMHGVTVNSFSSVSLDPMLVLVCLNETSRAAGLIECAGAFGVNVLSAGQRDISRWFANPDRPAGPAMFDGVPLEPGVTGCPVLAGAAASFDCRLRQSYRAGDHLIVLGEVVALVHRPQLEPLVFHAGAYHQGLDRRHLPFGRKSSFRTVGGFSLPLQRSQRARIRSRASSRSQSQAWGTGEPGRVAGW